MSHDKRSSGHHQLHPAGSGIPSTSLLSEETLEKKIENIGIVFCLIDDKDVFKKYYAKFLAKRLIKGVCMNWLTSSCRLIEQASPSHSTLLDIHVRLRDVDRKRLGDPLDPEAPRHLRPRLCLEAPEDAERQTVEQGALTARVSCTYALPLHSLDGSIALREQDLLSAFTAWMEEKDIELRRENATNALAISFHLSTSYHCDVLTAGAWPISSTTAEATLVLPPEVDAHIALFTKFYTERSSGRKLLWVHHLSFGTVQSTCFDKRYEFALSFYQILILLQVRIA